MKRGTIQFICLWTIVLSTSLRTQGVEFAGGTGGPDDPYQIATAEQLIAIGSDPNLLDKHFVLVNDINLDPNLSAAYAFDHGVIGGSFRGVFDGGGFSIRHLTSQNSGLFGNVFDGGEVKRLILEDVRIASLAKYASVGALCRGNFGVLFQCSVTGTVSGLYWTGGLAGYNEGLVEQCRSICEVSGEGWTGGLIGNNTKGGYVQNCHAGGHVSGRGLLGGLVGYSTGNAIHYSYAACQVDGTSPDSGGLVGNAYSPGSVMTHSYFLDASDGGGPDNGIGVPLTREQMKQPENLIGWDFWGTGNDGFRVPWFMPENGSPELSWLALGARPKVQGSTFAEAYEMFERAGIEIDEIQYDFDPVIEWGRVSMIRPQADVPPGAGIVTVISLGVYDWSTNPGTGDANDPYVIFSPGQLDCLARQPHLWNKHFKLVSDLDLAWRIYKGALLGRSGENGTVFDGTFDGEGHIIRNLTMEEGTTDENGRELLGFFGETGPSAQIKDLGLRDIWIRGQNATGGMLCAINRGHIERCYSRGTLQASYGKLGGLVGSNAGVIENCYAMGEVARVPGIYGGELYAGLVAENLMGAIRTCYATCRAVFGLVGRNVRDSAGRGVDGPIEYSLWDKEASGARSSDGGTGLLTVELMDIRVLQSLGWGGNPNWVVDDGKDYPRLIWEGTPGSLIPELGF